MGTRGAENEIPTSPPPPWVELPGDVTANILGRLGAEEILKSAEKVCTTWKKVCMDPAMWRAVDLKKPWNDGRDFNLMCRCAVDRSQGQLTDLSITNFGEDELLDYVADRSSDLRRLTLTEPGNDISAFGLAAAVKKLPQLEELHIDLIRPLRVEDVETIGISCPLLNSFTYNGMLGPEYESNGICLAIAKTMPNLHHLRLGGDAGLELEAVLDGCPHLESLDLWHCFGLHLTGALRERCSNQIKFLRLPIDPSDDDSSDDYDSVYGCDYDYDYYSDNEYAVDGYHYDYYY